MKHRIMSLLLCGLIVYFSFSEFAIAGNVQNNICTHEHTDACYALVKACVYGADSADSTDEEDETDIIETDDTDTPQPEPEHVCSEESGCIKRILLCPHVHDETCGYFRSPQPTSILTWEWVDEEEYLVQDEDTGAWGLGLPGVSADNPVTAEVLEELLPAEIDAAFFDKTTETLPLVWDLTSLPENGAYEGTYTLTAAPPEEYTLDTDAPELTVLLDLGGGGETLVSDSVLQSHIVRDSVIQPPNVKINLFDYGVTSIVPPAGQTDLFPADLKESIRHLREKPSRWGIGSNYVGMSGWNRGINENHLLIFGDAIVHAGFWNKGAGSSNTYGKLHAGMENIVKNVLENGYPSINLADAEGQLPGHTDLAEWKLAGDHVDKTTVVTGEYAGTYYVYDGDSPQNLSNGLLENWERKTGQTRATGTESLAYLFNPDVSHPYKTSYENITGLFQRDNNGYYYYNMRQNFAELDTSNNKFILYDAPATTPSDGSGIVGNFFPFNKGSYVFTGVNGNTLTSDRSCSAADINHYFGMTMDVDFRQPVNGKISTGGNQTDDMIFEFSGDDDVWIYIDDVLVLDLGGVHSEIYGTINFATGEVLTGRAFNADGTVHGIPENPLTSGQNVVQTTLKDLFIEAGVADSTQWKDNTNTFASNTDHTLKLFYLERGNYDSSLTLRFNLVPRLFQQIKKVDQDGSPLEDVQFALYAAQKTADGYVQVGDVLTTLETDADGLARFIENGSITDDNPEGDPFNFADRYTAGTQYYILKETVTPPGYRSLPTDIVLEFESDTSMLVVANPWTTGAYSSFTSTIVGNQNITYGSFDTGTGDIKPTEGIINATESTSGLIVAVPMLLEKSTEKWKALYGSNVAGFSAVRPEQRTEEEWCKAILTAFLYQCSDPDENTPDWYLYWSEDTLQLEATLTDLPGRADRYRLNSADGDMKMVYAIIRSPALNNIGISPSAKEDIKYEQLGAAVNQLVAEGMSREKAVETVRDRILNVNDGFRFLNTDQFSRNFRSLIYIPNEQRELRVWKVDQDGFARNGAEFTLYRYNDNGVLSGEAAKGITGTVDKREGVLIFTPSPPEDENGKPLPGYAKIEWARSQHDTYYLKETKAPEGYKVNDTVIPVRVGIYSIYADAGTPEDGVTVMAGVGKLAQTMKKYAADEEVNITLRDITATAQVQATGDFQTDGWTPMLLDGTNVPRSMNLHYDLNALVNYGLHNEDGGDHLYPYFVTDTGFITARVQQNWKALNRDTNKYGDETSSYDANKQNLGDTDITSLFSLLNVVVVTDQTEEETKTGGLTISKTITGEINDTEEYFRNFKFKLTLTDADGTEFGPDQKFYFYGTDKSGYINSGMEILLHHDESITILGLPEGTRYKVEEILNPADGYTSIGGPIREGVIIQTTEDQPPAAAEYVNALGVVVPFQFTKVDAVDLAKPLAGARFTMYWWNGAGDPDTDPIPLTGAPAGSGWMPVGKVTSGADGLVDFGKLAKGTYRLIETAAPDGYILPQAQWQISVIAEHGTLKIESVSTVGVVDNNKPPAIAAIPVTDENGVTTYMYKLPNLPMTELPFTGGRQTYWYMLLGGGMICTAAASGIWYSVSGTRKKSGVKKC